MKRRLIIYVIVATTAAVTGTLIRFYGSDDLRRFMGALFSL